MQKKRLPAGEPRFSGQFASFGVRQPVFKSWLCQLGDLRHVTSLHHSTFFFFLQLFLFLLLSSGQMVQLAVFWHFPAWMPLLMLSPWHDPAYPSKTSLEAASLAITCFPVRTKHFLPLLLEQPGPQRSPQLLLPYGGPVASACVFLPLRSAAVGASWVPSLVLLFR